MPRTRPRTRSRLYSRPDSPFIWAVYSDHEGHVRRESTGCRDDEAARLWLATREMERVKGEAGFPVVAAVPLLRAAAEYIEVKRPDWAEAWTEAVERYFQKEVVPWFGPERAVGTLTSGEIEGFRTALTQRPDRRRKSGCCRLPWKLRGTDADRRWGCERCGAPPAVDKQINLATVNRLFWALDAFGSWAVKRNYAKDNPWSGFEPFKEDDEGTPDLTELEFDAVLRALAGRTRARFPWPMLFEFTDITGLRKSELGRLARADINRQDRKANVVSSARRGRSKTNQYREVGLTERALEIIDLMPERPDGLVFGPIPDPRRAFAAAAKEAGLRRVWLHLMRHTGAHRIGRAGATLADLMGFGGWSTPKMATRYTKTSLQRQHELMARAARSRTSESPLSGHGPGTPADSEKSTGG